MLIVRTAASLVVSSTTTVSARSVMPAKGNEEQNSSSSHPQYESLFRDCNVVDSLVYDIKENLKLTHAAAGCHAGGKMKGGRSHAHGGSAARGPRLHPYSVPPSSREVVVM